MINLQKRLDETIAKLKIEEKKKKIEEIGRLSSDPNFWTDHIKSTVVMKELSFLSKQIKQVEDIQKLLDIKDFHQAEKAIGSLEMDLYFSGDHDFDGAILSLHAGQGGTEAMDWTEMLFRMYLRYCENQGWQYEIIDKVAGDEAGLKSVTFSIPETLAYGLLKSEAGVHRLVRQSPFNADKLRQTSFALAEVIPILEEDNEIEIRDDELEWHFTRSSGKGGQNVNKVSTAVRLVHKPTGIIVESQQERYQGQNRETALKILRGKIWRMMEDQKVKHITELKGLFKMASWGNQIRSYVLHPYHMVKDLRTGYETSDTDSILNGKLDDIILSYLKKMATGV
ncbi:peptide chain release factor 2 [Candidatus Gottesmanbacteria bacterium]|nr:peptide chain release factor 2 [Candidatus Gottesmanbacteria bacterium]